MDRSPAIVVASYNRPGSLKRILRSIEEAVYDTSDIPLIISIDYSGSDETYDIADQFIWKFGKKRIIKHSENLGLRKHILSCGDLTAEYGSIIMLEDDLYVSPYFYDYAKKAKDHYGSFKEVVGISLYSPCYDESSLMGFSPLKNGYSTYLKKVPSSWGQLWIKSWWEEFRLWYNDNSTKEFNSSPDLPECILLWPETSWKKYFYKFMIERDKLFVYPYLAYSTNFSDIGVNHKDSRTTLQVPLCVFKENYKFVSPVDINWFYDQNSEVSPSFFKSCIGEKYCHYFDDVTIDLYGSKPGEKVKTKYILTSKPVDSSKVILQFGSRMKPHEMNIYFRVEGSTFSLLETQYILNSSAVDPFSSTTRLSYYYGIREMFLNHNYLVIEE